MSDCLIDKRDDGVALITLNRPESLNAMGGNLLGLLGEHLADCAEDPQVRCVALTGAGRGFCGGGDVKGMAAGSARAARTDAPREGGSDSSGGDASLMQAEGLHASQMATSYVVYTLPKPTVALVNGPAAGAGMSLALSCDIRICSEEASFHTAFSKIGLSGDFGGSYHLQRIAGYGRALELYYTGDKINAQRALELGIANQVVPHEELMTRGLEFCAMLAAGPTKAYAHIKENFRVAVNADFEGLLKQEARTMTASMMTKDFIEGGLSFVQKRAPDFKGE